MRTAKISLALILPVLLVLSVAFAPLPLAAAPAHASSNNLLYLGSYAPTTTYPYYKYTQASLNVSAYAGGNATAVDGVKVTPQGYFDINFSGITISSGQVTLYTSTNAQAAITSGDTVWVANLPTSYIQKTVHTSSAGPLENFYNVTYNGMTFSLGNYSVIGPAPTVAGGSYYLKAFFGSTAPVATSAAEVVILPNIEISPTSGPVGTTITVTGSGFSASSPVNLTYYYKAYPSATKFTYVYITSITSNAQGQFTTTVNAPEMHLDTYGASGPAPGAIYFVGNDTATLRATPTYTFTENPREFIEIKTFNPSGAPVSSTTSAWNGTFTGKGYVLQPVIIAGNYFYPNSQVTITFAGSAVGTASTNGTGFFNTTVTVPVEAYGTYPVNVTDPWAYMNFHVAVQPTLIVSPSTVQPNGTVSIEGYAFSGSGPANVTWVHNDGNQYVLVTSVANLTANSMGEFSTTFQVPGWVAGGTYVINASANRANPTAYDTFSVAPLLELSSNTAPLGTQVTATAYGLGNYSLPAYIVTSYSPYTPTPVTLGHSVYMVGFAYDNVPIFGGLPTNEYTTASVTLQAAGYPMAHYVQLYNASVTPYSIIAALPLNVTGTTNTEAATTSALNQMSSQLTTMGSTLTTIQGSLTTLTSEYTNLSTAVGNLGSTLNSDYSSLSSSLGSLSSSVSSGFSSVSSTLGTINSGVSSIESSLSSMGSTLSSVQAEAAQISSINSLVLATIVIAVIVLVLEIVVLIRRR